MATRTSLTAIALIEECSRSCRQLPAKDFCRHLLWLNSATRASVKVSDDSGDVKAPMRGKLLRRHFYRSNGCLPLRSVVRRHGAKEISHRDTRTRDPEAWQLSADRRRSRSLEGVAACKSAPG